MNYAPPVSVLLPVYNGMPYLRGAIESVLSQTLEDFELIIVDDASTDDSVPCIQQFTDPRIRLWRNSSNMGQAWSMNKGLELSRAAYVARLDQDDTCLPDRLRQQVEWLDRHPQVTAAGTWMYWIDQAGRTRGLIGLRVNDFGTCLGILLNQATPLGHPTAMFRRELILALGRYDESCAPCEDYDLWCRLALGQHRMEVIPRPLVMVRMHRGQQTATNHAIRHDQARRAHLRFLSAFCPDQAQTVGLLLRGEQAFWSACPSSRQVQDILRMVQALLKMMRDTLQLSPQDFHSLQQRLRWWLGRCAMVGILQQHRQSLWAYRYALKGGLRMLRYPAILLYPLCFLCSPLFVPVLRSRLLQWARILHRQQYPARLVLNMVRTAQVGRG